MHKIRVSGVLVLLALGIAFMASAQAADDQACGQTIQATCTKCHPAAKICAKLDKGDADWKKIVATMGQRGNLPQASQDAAVKCLTSTEAKQQVCGK
jgi:hypothetical protein